MTVASWTKFSVGSSHIAHVKREHINNSEPCNKDNCMLSRAVVDLLVTLYGKKFKVKSTNHGVVLSFEGRRIVFVFDTNTAQKIWVYDNAFKKMHSVDKAWASVRPFRAKLMVESNKALPVYPVMSDATKKALRANRKANGRLGYHPTRETKRRELSL